RSPNQSATTPWLTSWRMTATTRQPKKMTVSESMCTGTVGGCSAALRRALDAEARRRHRLEAGLGEPLMARLALAVGAGIELGQGCLDIGPRFAPLPRERLDLAPLGGDLPGVGEVLVEVEVGVVAVPEAGQLLAHAAPLFLELVAQHRVGRVRHGTSLL